MERRICNEGFATYLSGLVVENFEEESSFTSWKQSRVNSLRPQGLYISNNDTTVAEFLVGFPTAREQWFYIC